MYAREEIFPKLGGSGGMLHQKILKFRVSEMPSPGFSAGHFQYIMRQKCSRKLFILAISLVFSVSYSVPKRKKKIQKQ